MQTSMLLLMESYAALDLLLRTSSADAAQLQLLLQHMLVEQRLPQLLAQLLTWLQQRPEFLCPGARREAAAAAPATAQPADAAAQPVPGSVKLWRACMGSVEYTAIAIGYLGFASSTSAAGFAEQLTETLSAAGGWCPATNCCKVDLSAGVVWA
jgi:hypothetical protein